MKSKKIVIFVTTISRKNGGMSTALDLAETLHSLGYDVHIGLAEGHVRYLLKGTRKYATTIPSSQLFTIPARYTLAANDRAGESIIQRVKRLLFSLLFLVGQRLRNFERILSGAEVLIYAGGRFSGQARAEIRKLTSAKFIRNHAGSPDTYENVAILDHHVVGTFASKRERYAAYCRSFDGILFQAKEQADECISRGKDLAQLCYVVQPSCNEASVIAASLQASPYSPAKRIIVSVGSIQSRKNQLAAFESFAGLAADFPDVELHFVGGHAETEYGRDLQRRIDESRFRDRVFLHGHRSDYLRYIAHAHLMVQSSLAEGVSRVLREAMLLKTPIVSFAISGTSSILTNQLDALLVTPGDTTELGAAMRLIFEQPQLGQSLAKAAHSNYLTHLSWPVYATSLAHMLARVSAKDERKQEMETVSALNVTPSTAP